MVKPAGKLARLDKEKVIQAALQSNPANSGIRRSTANNAQERSNNSSDLLVKGVGVHRMRMS